ncbi:MAG: twin-arginine translocation signal domain-containing protein [Dehalococcoidia bacterium]|nr:MAG: twin-arginine translocation signal domain-containing protein [Dehalococcoidia bacterium]
MEFNRRDFLKLSGGGAGAAVVLGLMPATPALAVPAEISLKKKSTETKTICCYCGVGCGAVVSTYEDGSITVEGDPDHPINEGSLCPKGMAMGQINQVDGALKPYRLTKPLYRAPYATDWEEKSWDWIISRIAETVKATRDNNWNQTAARTDAIASLGGGELDNEECYLLAKMSRALGVVYLEHCARI